MTLAAQSAIAIDSLETENCNESIPFQDTFFFHPIPETSGKSP
jgi:hypothetical protein